MKTGCSFHSWSVIYSYLYTRYYYLFICIYNMKYWLWWWRKFYWVKVVTIQYKNTPLQVNACILNLWKYRSTVRVSKLKVLMQNSTSVIFMICMLQEYYYWSINLESAFFILSTWRILLKLYMLLGSLNIAMHHIL